MEVNARVTIVEFPSEARRTWPGRRDFDFTGVTDAELVVRPNIGRVQGVGSFFNGRTTTGGI